MRSDAWSNRVLIFVFLAAAVLLGAPRWHWMRISGGLIPVPSRTVMRDLVLPQLGGGEWRLADHRGQVVLINYWATWCEPCRDELPGLVQLNVEYSPKGLALVAVSMDRGPDARMKVEQFASRYRLPYEIAFPDAIGKSESDLQRLPTTLLIDRQGRVARIYAGAVEREDLERDVAALLSSRI